jgi:hypothetical protein
MSGNSKFPSINFLIYKTILKPIRAYGNTTLGYRIHVQHGNTGMFPVEGSAHDNGRTMVRAECGNTEGSPNLNA